MNSDQVVGFSEDYTRGGLKELRLKLIGATDLAKKDIFGLSDPYAVVKVYRTKRMTNPSWKKVCEVRGTTRKKTLAPEWNDVGRFLVDPDRTAITIQLYDANRITRDDFLGQVRIRLSEWDIIEISDLSLPLDEVALDMELPLQARTPNGVAKGTLHLNLVYTKTIRDDSRNRTGSVRFDSFLADDDAISMIGVGTEELDQTLPLPEGWDEKVDGNGRTFYVNHQDRSTQWSHPLESRRGAQSRSFSPPVNESGEGDETDGATARATTRRHISVEDSDDSQSTITNNIEILRLDSAEEPIPAGWQMGKAPNGRVFFIDHASRATSWIDPRTGKETSQPSQPPSDLSDVSTEEELEARLGPMPSGWAKQVDSRSGRVYFIDHISKKTSWQDPRLGQFEGPEISFSAGFKAKYDGLRYRMRKPSSSTPNKYDITVRREHILEDSFTKIMAAPSTDHLMTRLWIEFSGEPGLDYGGVQREFYYLLSKEMFNPYYGLFMYSAIDDYTLQINPNSATANPDHLQWFRFIGRVTGLAVYHGRLLDGFFVLPFYKRMLGQRVELKDMEPVDVEYYNSLCYILENDVDDLDLRFMASDSDLCGMPIEVELMDGGEVKVVTIENKSEYVQLLVEWRLVRRIGEQMNSFMQGFNEFVPAELLSNFASSEVELLIGGIQSINVADWRQHTTYKNHYTKDHPTIILFWKFVYTLSNEQRTKLLQYSTGTSKVPPNGFRALHGTNGQQNFTIQQWGTPDLLPQAHTCFNRLELPPYPTYEDLRTKVLIAMDNAAGFGTD